LMNHRQRLVSRATALKLQVGAVLREQRVKIGSDRGGRWSKNWVASVKDNDQLSSQGRWIVNDLLEEIEHCKKKIESVQQRLREVTEGDEVVKKLMKQPGIGQVTAWMLRAYIGRFDRFKTAKQLSRYCGLSPRNASSGNKTADAGLIDGCNKMLRATIVQAAHRLVRMAGHWKDLADSMRKRGKPTCVVIAAVGNRWMRRLHHVMKEVTPAGQTAPEAANS
jgi:transposase